LVQPDDGIGPLVDGIENARDSVEIVIFRCDRTEIERALADAVSRGVVLVLVGIASCWTPALRSLRIEPMTALRPE